MAQVRQDEWDSFNESLQSFMQAKKYDDARRAIVHMKRKLDNTFLERMQFENLQDYLIWSAQLKIKQAELSAYLQVAP